ncbi:3',5'-nucleoside bisphosphate phosphatase [Methylotenera sp.]|uniref:3',5'-nucleoside bisphosphate phosphatase n=1 Tax=Methylotenera sp. TaxID=2051956 RepID=UPI00271D9944|nr:3',5'-nucleoside bisphosphate phosphatase [Methylotenera sp.]MDO9204258.1 3',5'-nucleoside bisphosphate phosphatase [Methylotenera sp.]MDP2071075.1 3',5'-nucleoside bisphosphate phosphatase [Methylotenera sp.]MDP3005949.1 3',5'-nucleoside bisphosphate phosphatase [Methylotenera sp.]MDP3817802.1 3',5'-nucleoside bisphosphate phosphatase [Methylotenera sp.]MDZ4211208.1 3',5'-nucleoside bisphosphate phosphatase [Methylotenera sp.]
MSLIFDLHSHSNISDGLLSPAELVEHAAMHNVDVLALTDHDDTGGLEVAASEAKRLGLQFINGVEISVTWKKRTLHIVGLKIDPQHPPLKFGLESIRAGRHTRAAGMAAGLEKVGIKGSLEGAYQYATEGIIGRIHFARFLVDSGISKDTKSVFKKYLVKGKPGYFEHQWASLEDAVNWIVGSGGVAVLAHPGRYDLGRINMLLLLNEFRALGGAAIEVVTGSHTGAQYVEYAKYAQLFGLKSSQGSDYHGKGLSFMEMGRLPMLPSNCVPVWHDWPEALL